MKPILLASSALLLVGGLAGAEAQDDTCPAEIDAFTRDYEEAMAAFAPGDALSASEQSELTGLRTSAETAYRAGKQELCLEAIDRARLMLETAIAPTALQPRELQGMEVRNAEDEYLGEVDGVTLDPISGRIAYVLVEHGGFLGIGDSLFPVPWRAVTWAPGAEALLLNVNEEQLENAPRYLDEEVTPQERRGWLLSVHSYYGVEPYWQDNLPSMALGAGAGAAATGGEADEAVAGAPAARDAAEPAGTGEAAEVVVVEPESAAGSANAAAPDDDAPVEAERAEGQATDDGAGEGQLAEASAESAEANAGERWADALMARMDELESRIAELSQQGVGEEVRQAIADLQAQVQELARQEPGEEIRAALADLQSRVQSLSEQAPGEELRGVVADLQSRVQELSRSEPGEELRETIARMETEIRRLAGGGSEAGKVAGFASGASGGDAVEGQATEPGTVRGADASGSEGSGVAGQVIVIEPEDVQVIEPGQAASDEPERAGMPAGQAAAGQAPAAPAVPASESDLSNPAGGEAQAGLAAVEPCDASISRLEEDLARAEEMGLAVSEAQNELLAAQAMLERDSQALCRAAIKRALDELVAQGFQPAQAN